MYDWMFVYFVNVLYVFFNFVNVFDEVWLGVVMMVFEEVVSRVEKVVDVFWLLGWGLFLKKCVVLVVNLLGVYWIIVYCLWWKFLVNLVVSVVILKWWGLFESSYWLGGVVDVVIDEVVYVWLFI